MNQRPIEKKPSYVKIKIGKKLTLLKIPKTIYSRFTWSISIAIILIIFPFLTLSSPILVNEYDTYVLGDQQLSESLNLDYYRIFVVFILIIGITQRLKKNVHIIIKNIKTNHYIALFFLFILLVSLNSLLAFNTKALTQAGILILYTSSFILFFNSDEENRLLFYRIMVISLIVFILLSLIIYWPPKERWFGGIHPNIYAQFLVILSILALFIKSTIKYFIITLTIFLAILISSRYAIIGIILATLLFYSLNFIKIFHISIYILVITVVFPPLINISLKISLIREILELDNSDRGLDSGATGRFDRVPYFFSQIQNNFLTGYGFRQRENYYDVHNGFLNTILENGIFISIFLFIIIISKYIQITYKVSTSLNDNNFVTKERRMINILFTIILWSAFFQPQLINFGDLMGISMIACLSYPIEKNFRKAKSS